MKANYEPVMAVLDMVNSQNKELQINRDSVTRLLHSCRDLILSGKMRWDLIQPEFKQLQLVRSEQRSMSIFNIFGRSRASLTMTRLLLIIMRKSIAGSHSDQSTVADDQQILLTCIDHFVYCLTFVDSNLMRVSSWWGSPK